MVYAIDSANNHLYTFEDAGALNVAAATRQTLQRVPYDVVRSHYALNRPLSIIPHQVEGMPEAVYEYV